MILVALETATPHGSVALLRGERLVERGCALRGTGALPELEALLAEEGVRPGEIGAVAVSIGPGSFTGVRIGVAAAQGFAVALGCPIVGVGTLEGLAEAARRTDWGMPGAFVLPLVDARRGEVYAALYRVEGPQESPASGAAGEGGDALSDAPSNVRPAVEPLRLLRGPETLSRGRLLESLAGVLPEEARVDVGVLCGDGAAMLAPHFPPGSGWAAPSILARARAGAIARVGARKIARGEGVDAESLQPVYLRKSDAEIAREKHTSTD